MDTSFEQMQSALILAGPKQRYKLVINHPIPQLGAPSELLIKTEVIGLNPIDWKGPDFNFGIPSFPYISGRELVGTVVQNSQHGSRIQTGDRVIFISTDYRDIRKAAYQHFVAAPEFNTVRLPPTLDSEAGASLGVAFVTSALALGICFGLNFQSALDGPDIFEVIRSVEDASIPGDVLEECRASLLEEERAVAGDWVAIWGASATSAVMLTQLAHLAGLKVAAVVDQAKHGLWLSESSSLNPDMLVDGHSPERAVEILRSALGDRLRFGVDTRGKESAAYLLESLRGKWSTMQASPSPPSTPSRWGERRAHLVGLTGLPKIDVDGSIRMHTVPLKVFHAVPAVGRALCEWMERLLATRNLAAPRILGRSYGLNEVNNALDRMRQGEICGGKAIVVV